MVGTTRDPSRGGGFTGMIPCQGVVVAGTTHSFTICTAYRTHSDEIPPMALNSDRRAPAGTEDQHTNKQNDRTRNGPRSRRGDAAHTGSRHGRDATRPDRRALNARGVA